jgi:hypothetical protein
MTFATTNPASVTLANALGFLVIFCNDTNAIQYPATLTFYYNATLVANAGMNENALVVWYFNETTGSWVQLGGMVDTATHTLTVLLYHFSTFCMGSTGAQSNSLLVLGVWVGVLVVGAIGAVAFVEYKRRRNPEGFAEFRTQVKAKTAQLKGKVKQLMSREKAGSEEVKDTLPSETREISDSE